MVGVVGFEPTRLAAPAFETGVTTNSTTPRSIWRRVTESNCHRLITDGTVFKTACPPWTLPSLEPARGFTRGSPGIEISCHYDQSDIGNALALLPCAIRLRSKCLVARSTNRTCLRGYEPRVLPSHSPAIISMMLSRLFCYILELTATRYST